MIKGKTCMEVYPKGRSAAEISELWAYLEARIRKGVVYGAAA
jgi:chromosome partitioning protein